MFDEIEIEIENKKRERSSRVAPVSLPHLLLSLAHAVLMGPLCCRLLRRLLAVSTARHHLACLRLLLLPGHITIATSTTTTNILRQAGQSPV